jgi:hypothetical protein
MSLQDRTPHDDIELLVRGQKAVDFLLKQADPSKDEALASVLTILKELSAGLARLESVAASCVSRLDQLEFLVRTKSDEIASNIADLRRDDADAPDAGLPTISPSAPGMNGAGVAVPPLEPYAKPATPKETENEQPIPGTAEAHSLWRRNWPRHVWLLALGVGSSIGGAAYFVWRAAL